MEGILQITLLLVLTASLVLQLFAVILGFRLVRFSLNRPVWIMLSVALVLMLVRQAVVFAHMLTGGANHFEDVLAECVAFVISLLLVAVLLSVLSMVRRDCSLTAQSSDSPMGELFARIPSGVAVYEAVDKGRDFIVLDINPGAERIEKVSREHVIGSRLTEAFPGVEEFGLLDVLRRVWKTGRPEHFPLHYYRDDRTSGWRDSFVFRRPEGELVSVYSDVSVQMRVQEEMERWKHRFRILFEQIPLPYQVLDGDGTLLEVNPAWLRLTGLDRKSSTGRPFSELLSRTGRRRFSEVLVRLRETGSVKDVALELIRKNGIAVNVTLTAHSQTDRQGGLEQIYCMVDEHEGQSAREDHPGMEQRAKQLALELQAADRRELQQKRLSLFGELTGGLAYELNLPLAAARNAFNLMRQDMSPASPQYEFAGIASRELSLMADLVEQMYLFHGTVSMDSEIVNINALLDNTLVLLRRRIKECGVHVKDERAPTVPTVCLPPAAVMLTLINPVKNSLDAMLSGGILTLRTGAEAGGVFVEIEDNGPGIPPDFLPRLFDPFTTYRHSGSAGGGPGLGMAQVQHTLNVLGGSIQVESRIGEGTRVKIVFPNEIKTDA